MTVNAGELDPSEWTADRVVFSAATNALLHASEEVDVQPLRKSISWRIMDLEHEIRALKSRYNASSSIYRLPQETLSEIFLALADDVEDDREWIGITFVCRHWRTVALECTALWTALPIINAAFTDAVLPRTKDAPLSLMIDEEIHSPGIYGPLFKKVMTQLGRLEILELRLKSDEWALEEVLAKCAESAVLLRDLMVTFPNHGYVTSIRSIPTLKKVCMPSLENIQLVHCGARWSDIHFGPGLISISLQTTVDAHRPTLSQFVNALKETQVLDVLSLTGFLPSHSQVFTAAPSSTSLPAVKRVKLQELTQLYLVDTVAAINQFFRLVQLPQVNEIQLAFCGFVRDPHVVNSVLSSLQESWFDDGWSPLKHRVEELYIAGMDHKWVDGGQTWGFTIGCLSPDGSNSTLTLRVYFKDSLFSQTALFDVFNKQLDLSSVTSLHFDKMPVSPADWKDTYGSLSNVQEITIDHGVACAFEFIRALQDDPTLSRSNAYPSERPPPSPLFPSLKELRLCHMSIPRLRNPRAERFPFASTLATMLRKRAEARYPIPLVRFIGVKGFARSEVQDMNLTLGTEILTES
ncbi:hypothetical protein NMY22_g8492 [Coprinellus aureogranulatus]|nr:hypothetical protein NMY22_g8492 [Coprinellus aureogranulatus]